MMVSSTDTRTQSFGENHKLTPVDRLGVWLSTRRIIKLIKKRQISSMADLGCGFDARLSQIARPLVLRSVVVDVALNPELIASSEFDTFVGELPSVLTQVEQESFDFIVMNSVLEHLDEPVATLANVRQLLAPEGLFFVNVPSWQGKRLLELLAFKLHVSPMAEMEDHRRYYNKRELWLELRAAGFMPSKIKIRRHKLGTNVYALVEV